VSAATGFCPLVASGTVSLPRRIGRHRTAHLALTGHTIDAVTALDWGLIDQIDQAVRPQP
jgi:enoyl-CoA hydratase/carnithine racemase